MVELFDTGAYLLHGQELVADNAEAAAALRAKTGKEISTVRKIETVKKSVEFYIRLIKSC